MYNDSIESFTDCRYKIIRNVIDNKICKLTAIDIKLLEDKQKFLNKNEYTNKNNCFSYYSALITEALLLFLKPTIERCMNVELSPTYSLLQIYYNKSIQSKIKNSDACEYSASLCISIDETPWELWIKDENDNDIPIVLYPGDMIIYKGVEHWRNTYDKNHQIQVYLHYVNANGIYNNYIYDNRPILGIKK